MRCFLIHEKTDNGYSRYAPGPPGCVAADDGLPETKALLGRAIVAMPAAAAEYLEVPAA